MATRIVETPEQELARLRSENAKLKAGEKAGFMGYRLSLKVSTAGAVQVNGMGRFPTTLYKEQMLALLDAGDSIRAFIAENDGVLKAKDRK